MPRPEYVEIECKSALNRVQGMPFKWSLNPYSGCRHECVYCYARSHYALADRGDPGSDFANRIYVKTNFPAVLRREVVRPSWKSEHVALGSATDCYQPAEGRYRLTRGTLEVLVEQRNPVSIVTKSPLIVRDVDLLAALAATAKVRIFFTVTTLDDRLWRLLEPSTAPPRQRLRALRRLIDAGVPAGVLLAPILPGLTDSVESIDAIARAADEHGAAFFGATALRLAPVVKDHFFGFLGDSFPDLVARYRRAYPYTNAPRDYQDKLTERVARIRERYGFTEESLRRRYSGFAPIQSAADPDPPDERPRQLSLPLYPAG